MSQFQPSDTSAHCNQIGNWRSLRIVLGLLLAAAGVALFLLAPFLPKWLTISESTGTTAGVAGLLLLAIGASTAATARSPVSATKWLWATGALATGALLVHLIQNRLPNDPIARIVLRRTSPTTFWFAASGCLGYSMLLIGEACGARFVGRNALAFILMLIVATTLHAFLDLRGYNATPELVPRVEWIWVVEIFLGVIQLVFLLLLIGEVMRSR